MSANLNNTHELGLREATSDELQSVAGGEGILADAVAALKSMGEILSNVSKTRSEISMTFARNARA